VVLQRRIYLIFYVIHMWTPSLQCIGLCDLFRSFRSIFVYESKL